MAGVIADSLSAAQLLALDGIGASARVLTCPEDGMVVLSCPEKLADEHVPFMRYLVAHLADTLGIERSRVVVLEQGATLEALTAEQLAMAGLRRDG